jgi:hypothetical protein
MWKVIDKIDIDHALYGRPEPTFNLPWEGDLTEKIIKETTDLSNARL